MLVLLVVLAVSLIVGEDSLADPPDTLDLQLQWSYPLEVADMKLVDFGGDGINEILVGFNSDSARVGYWMSPPRTLCGRARVSWALSSPLRQGTETMTDT